MSRFVHVSVIAILVVGGAGAYAARAWRLAHALTPDQAAAIPERLARIPLQTEDPTFRGTRDYLQDRIVDLSGADYYAAIDYQAEGGGAVRLHVGAATGTDAWLHEPTVCLPTHGWTTTQAVLVPIWEGLPGVEPAAQVWRMTLHKTGEQLLVYYWLQWGEHIVTSRFQRAWLRFKGLVSGSQDRPIQIVILYAPTRGSVEHGEARVASLVRALWPDLSTILSPGVQNHASSPP